MRTYLLFAATLLLAGTCWAHNPNDRLTFRFLVDSPLRPPNHFDALFTIEFTK